MLRLKTRGATLEALRALGGEAKRRDILTWASSHGRFTERERTASAPPKATHKYTNALDHQLAWVLTNLKREGLVTNPKWSTWCLAPPAKPKRTSSARTAPSSERLAELRKMPYRLYLRTPEWKRVRDAALLENGYACSMDVSHKEDLEVHHRSYENRGAERPADLIVLCRRCHRLHHAVYGLPGDVRPAGSFTTLNRPDSESPDSEAPARRRRVDLPRRSMIRRAIGEFVRAQLND